MQKTKVFTNTKSRKINWQDPASDLALSQDYALYLEKILRKGFGVSRQRLVESFHKHSRNEEIENNKNEEEISELYTCYLVCLNSVGYSPLLSKIRKKYNLNIECIIPTLTTSYGVMKIKSKKILIFYIIISKDLSSDGQRKRILGSLKKAKSTFSSHIRPGHIDLEKTLILESNLEEHKNLLNSYFEISLDECQPAEEWLITNEFQERCVLKDNLLNNAKVGLSMADYEAHKKMNYKDMTLFGAFFAKDFPDDWGKFVRENPDVIHTLDMELKSEEGSIIPTLSDVVRPFREVRLKDIKVIIIGQDPYARKGEATGYSFAVTKRTKIPRSLTNIMKMVKNHNYETNASGKDLKCWIDQGILPINTALTLEEGKSDSHKEIWSEFTPKLLNFILKNTENICFMLWGSSAKRYKKHITSHAKRGHFCIEACHPVARTKVQFANEPILKTYKEEIKTRGLEETHTLNWNIV